jgi:hypothetical protein
VRQKLGTGRPLAAPRGASAQAAERSLAFVVARSIGRKGIRGRQFFKRAKERVMRNLPGIAQRALARWRERLGSGAAS